MQVSNVKLIMTGSCVLHVYPALVEVENSNGDRARGPSIRDKTPFQVST
jgi:hypothetical protein